MILIFFSACCSPRPRPGRRRAHRRRDALRRRPRPGARSPRPAAVPVGDHCRLATGDRSSPITMFPVVATMMWTVAAVAVALLALRTRTGCDRRRTAITSGAWFQILVRVMIAGLSIMLLAARQTRRSPGHQLPDRSGARHRDPAGECKCLVFLAGRRPGCGANRSSWSNRAADLRGSALGSRGPHRDRSSPGLCCEPEPR